MELSPGKMVTSNVRLVELLGSGGMGSVWIADHLSLETQVAVKFVAKPLLEQDEAIVARFNREAALSAQIKSPHVVQIFDHGLTDEGMPFIVMELLEGENLGDRIERQGPLSVNDTRIVVTQTAKALAKAHQLGIVHRDIKPDNLFLVEPEFDLFIKVLDFGIAKQTRLPEKSQLTMTGAMVGTPEFMSPEQVLSAKSVDHRSDLWALGVVAYYALTGQVPFTGETLGALCVAIAAGEYPKVTALQPDLPRGLDIWFLRALATDPEQRFQSARALAMGFAQALGPAGIAAWDDPFSQAGESGSALPSEADLHLWNVDADRPPPPSRGDTLESSTLAAEAKTVATQRSPTFSGASLAATSPRRVPRAAMWTVLLLGLALGSGLGIWYVQAHETTADDPTSAAAEPTAPPPTDREPQPAPSSTADVEAGASPSSTAADAHDGGASTTAASAATVDAVPKPVAAPDGPRKSWTARPRGETTGAPTAHATASLPELPPDRGF